MGSEGTLIYSLIFPDSTDETTSAQIRVCKMADAHPESVHAGAIAEAMHHHALHIVLLPNTIHDHKSRNSYTE